MSEFFDVSLFGALEKFSKVANSALSKTFLTCHCLPCHKSFFFQKCFLCENSHIKNISDMVNSATLEKFFFFTFLKTDM
jgi:hypothetical protein